VLHVRGKDWRVLRPEQSDDEAETVLILKE
jgi:hypothetical protein